MFTFRRHFAFCAINWYVDWTQFTGERLGENELVRKFTEFYHFLRLKFGFIDHNSKVDGISTSRNKTNYLHRWLLKILYADWLHLR